MNCKKEISYSIEIDIKIFVEEDEVVRIGAVIYVGRKPQKGIIIGKGGEAIKKVGIEARFDMVELLANKAFYKCS